MNKIISRKLIRTIPGTYLAEYAEEHETKHGILKIRVTMSYLWYINPDTGMADPLMMVRLVNK